MRYDTIITGGGLSGLVAGISLVKQGKKCLIVSQGQSALHFFSGSFELLACKGNPMEAIPGLEPSHPYSKLGADKVKELVSGVKPFFADAGITLKGENDANHSRLTPLGVLKPTWLTLDEYITFPSSGELPWKTATVINVEGFLDFNANFVLSGLVEKGLECKMAKISLAEFEKIRTNPSEMRSTNIARVLELCALDAFAQKVKVVADGTDVVLLPAVLGLEDASVYNALKEKVGKPLFLMATMPPSVPGIRIQLMLKKYFQQLGGVYMLGDTVKRGEIKDGKLMYIQTENHGSVKFEADNFIFASGSFFSHGLEGEMNSVVEPVLGLDVDYIQDRGQWYERNFFDAQPYMKFGIATDAGFRAMKDGASLENVYVAGSALSGFNAIKDGCGAGVSILTAMNVAQEIINKK